MGTKKFRTEQKQKEFIGAGKARHPQIWRTDLAVEERESFEGDGGEVKGVSLREWHHKKSRIKLTEVSIMNEQGAKSMGKPMGTYLTLDVPQMAEKDDG